MIFDRFLPRAVRPDRVAVFIDGPNILRNEFDVDLNAFREQVEEYGTLAIAKAFLNQYASEKLVEALVSQGFEPVLGVGEDVDEASDVDVYLAASAMEAVLDDSIDVIILVTRDADFLPVIQKAKQRGKKTVVAGVPPRFSTALQHAADEVIEL